MNLLNVCRTCFRSDVTLCSLVVSITPKIETASDGVLGLWKIYNRILITYDASLPELICTDCADNIQQTYLFVMKCEKTESQFRLLNPNKEDSIDSRDEYIDISQLQTENLPQYERGQRNLCSQIKHTNQSSARLSSRADENSEVKTKQNYSVKSENYTRKAKQGGTNNGRLTFKVREVTDNLEYTVGVTCHGIEKVVKQEPECSLDADSVLPILDAIAAESNQDTGIQCPGCPFKCAAIERLEKHVVENHICDSLCKICNKEFVCTPLKHCWEHLPKTEDNLSNQFRSSKVKRPFLNILFPYKCEYCVKPFRSKTGYSYHMFAKHGHVEENEKVQECTVCCKCFKSNSALESHMRIHSGEKPYSCKFCGKKFVQKGHMIVHIRRHTGERPYKCMFCPKAFPDKSNFNKHLLFHTGEKPYPCRICLQRFQRKSSLDLHYMCHTGERPYECEICSKKFKQRMSWKEHMKIHTLSVDNVRRLNQRYEVKKLDGLKGVSTNEA